MTEIWQIVPSAPNYMASTLGRVRSVDHWVWGGPRIGYYVKAGRILKPGIASNDYPTVALGRGNTRTVHSLVAEAHLGRCPEGMEIRHKDGNRKNPCLDNLEFGTRGDNMRDASRHGTHGSFKPETARKILATKDRRYPGWRQHAFLPGGLKHLRQEYDL